MDLVKIKSLVDLVSESTITELEITEGEEKIKIVKSSNPSNQSIIPTALNSEVVLSGHDSAVKNIDNSYVVKAPMVGTFYRSSSPGASPFVHVGQAVKEGDTLCIIEAMKLLNEIESEKTGIIKEILVENGAPIEYGQHLFIID
ncbi:acetyl-CoA carboxylase biotin carboxyl carrier protein [Candidatus Kinetoplastidibacterium crithidiae]|uniref:Biotin carboxyl carrier protein of acetyl-CoA carboxylase n=1 Tax=Candidatus Kinetoplastidibacterium crithidiae TCC036E TaxID=1208918 RepID=M1L5I3_9PROT|nr:acetyl-CoA carboxylase biotin carboxyl carrier protein [Candidatus Kinetoplastibacterium crithidii]AFZ82898.1 acetyl-CoA carboxylase biotin carboxyl carrier protein [Candidatus Kinetoplastibacterium crithidii (ex Angomonas deanei ATCC 30255)]AGF47898.1 acetyl-CoA carboxylase biotin carboxyl carrier protein [Candidatus Kinetoplastibacterium crithidii TCC036E]